MQKENKSDNVQIKNENLIQTAKWLVVKRLKMIRQEAEMSQKTLARKSGVTASMIGRFERTGEISFTSLMKIALALGCISDFENLFKPGLRSMVRSIHNYE